MYVCVFEHTILKLTFMLVTCRIVFSNSMTGLPPAIFLEVILKV